MKDANDNDANKNGQANNKANDAAKDQADRTIFKKVDHTRIDNRNSDNAANKQTTAQPDLTRIKQTAAKTSAESTRLPPTQQTRIKPNNSTITANIENYSSTDAIKVLKQRFILEKVLGVGGMGVVYKAKDWHKVEAHDRDPYVAIKVLSEEFKTHP